MRHPFLFLLALVGACSEPPSEENPNTPMVSTGGAPSGGQSSIGSGGANELGSGGTGATLSTGGVASSTGGLSSGALSGGQGPEESNSGGSPTGGAGSGGALGTSSGGVLDEGSGGEPPLETFASELNELFIHDPCTGVQAQSDTCTHVQKIEKTVTFGGDAEASYVVTLRVRGLFEPTNIQGGTAPLPSHPYFVLGGTVQAADYSQWQIEVAEPHQVYTLNHYPQTSHTIYQEDFQAPILISGGSQVVVRVTDANDRQIDNGASGLADRQQVIEGVTEGVLDGQVLRLDVVSVVVEE